MRKKLSLLPAAAALIMFMCASLAAALPRYTDEINLLTPGEADELNALLDDISEQREFDIVILVTDRLDHREARLMAIDFFEEHEFGKGASRSGAVLLLAMEDRDYGYATKGYGNSVFTESRMDELEDKFLPFLNLGRYYDGLAAFARGVEDMLDQAEASAAFNRVVAVCGGLLLSFIIGFAVTRAWSRKLITVRRDDAAGAYVRDGSMALAVCTDTFLYRNVSKVRRASESSSSGGGSSSFSSSSGSRSTGRSGKF